MDFALSQEQAMLQSSAQRFFAESHPISRARRALSWADPLQPALWRQMAEMGWLGLLVPESRGGLGLGVTEAFLVAEAAGRQLLNLPYAASAVLLPLLQAAGDDGLDQWIEPILSGSASIELVTPESRYWDHHGQCSHQLLVEGLAAFEGPIRIADVTHLAVRSVVPALDPTLRCGPAPSLFEGLSWTLLDAGGSQRRRAHAGYRVVRLAEMLGAASASLDISCEYARTREQFGKPIGVNQAIKHQLCNAWMALDNARLAALYAVAALDGNLPDWTRACAIAELTCIEGSLQVARYGIQIHGGLGFTWEHDTHLYLKRIQHLSARLGGCEAAYQRLEAEVDGGQLVTLI
ncbi:MAG: acyl-CoA dehydrogenase family protein [Pseudomonadota bacterium]